VNNAARQARLIDDLLEVSRIVAGRVSLDLQEVDLEAVVRGAVEATLPAAVQRGLELRVGELPPARVVADLQRLEQVFVNLLANALKFTPAGGRVTVEGAVDNGTVRVQVIDTGAGIQTDVLPHIFERFRQGNNTTSRSVGGLGLGLFIVRRLIEAQHGQVAAASDGPGTGATFTISLPVASVSGVERPARPRDATERGAARVGPTLSGLHVLVVDDEADAREMMSSALDACGARVTTAQSVREALTILTREDARIDVMLSDVAMPEEDGYALIRQVRAHRDPAVARLPAAAVTACARDDERQTALAAGFHLHVAKPVAPEALIAAVARLAGMVPANT
jgi:CheY-like chemotaxis protein